jgi:hypothetical protein
MLNVGLQQSIFSKVSSIEAYVTIIFVRYGQQYRYVSRYNVYSLWTWTSHASGIFPKNKPVRLSGKVTQSTHLFPASLSKFNERSADEQECPAVYLPVSRR